MRDNRNRRGAEAVEFALVAPLLVVMVFGSIDYGLFFWQQFRAQNAILSAMRTGGLTAPEESELGEGTCTTCIAAVEAAAVANLAEVGIDVPAEAVRPTVIGVNGVCTLVIRSTIEFDSITGYAHVPESFDINIHTVAQGAKGC